MYFELKLLLYRDALARTPRDDQVLFWKFEFGRCVLGHRTRFTDGPFFITRWSVRGSKHTLAGDKKLVIVYIFL